MSGPLKWNRQQGLYIYRANRLVQHGGWSGIRGIDEHTKLARAAIDFDTDLDEAFQINVAKMRVALPPTLRQMLERPIHELCVRADDAYRQAANAGERKPEERPSGASDVTLAEVGHRAEGGVAWRGRTWQSSRTALEPSRSAIPDLAAPLGL